MIFSKLRILLCILALLLICLSCSDSEETDDFPDETDGDQSEDGDDEEEVGDGDEEEQEQPSIEFQAIEGLVPNFDFEGNSDFFAAPFPSDLRIKNGMVDYSSFPNPRSSSVISTYTSYAEQVMEGFGTNSPIYWSFPEAIDTASLPQDGAHSILDDSALLLINVDESNEGYGSRIPVEWNWTSTATVYEPDNLLAVAPINGFPLRPKCTYAMILTSNLKDASGKELGRSQEMADLFSGKGEGAFGEVYSPLVGWMSESIEDFDVDSIRAATVFSTLDPISEMKSMRDYIATEYPDGAIRGGLEDCEYIDKQDGYLIFEGHYSSPNFQQGETPYASKDGGIFFDDSGNPEVVRMESLRFAIAVPSEREIPANGWPICMQAHGTGGSYRSFIGRGHNDESTRALDVDIAMVGIDQPLHGPRGDWLSDDEVELYSFNFLNPEAGRNGFRQSAADTIALTQLIKDGQLNMNKAICSSWPGRVNYSGPDIIKLDTDTILFHGHSHGGLSGAIAASVEDEVKGWVLSGAGGRLSITVMDREIPNILEMIQPLVGLGEGEAHVHHPLLGLVQGLTEITDPINYAPYWIERPFNGHARNIFMTSGFLDGYTPKRTASALAAAGRLPQIEPVSEVVEGISLHGIESYSRPASENVSGPDTEKATAGFSQYPDDGHFAIYRNDDAASMVQEFMRSVAWDKVGVLGY